ncbi:4Fe-4S dicluster domain-containing protein [Fibrella forsythiae]|uniref:4Fe-4S dicluster domain-containing protein n=1 Tax=Fibrella forsythiae TaxID=2817061 RepID=A0ABS3JGZ4_9BACT|nr:4Fe-4S dicluster domain-containing protein [Fibrella forsythiae]MBO0949250.1 4Fe-4S dicluster domain-containing protein [Fibrella forsythiae]
MSYFSDISDGIRTTLKGLSLTVRHLRNATHRRESMGIADDRYFDLKDGLVTLQYPHEQLPIPDNGRYRLHNEIDDCIVCDKCAKVCPVDCITIDPIKATEEVGRASDGSPIRLYAAQFDIDMAKCCYCGLCTVVCPTECLTMEKKFDYSTFELGNLTYEFANLTPEQATEKRELYEQFVREKEDAKRLKQEEIVAKATPATAQAPAVDQPTKPKPAFRPGMKPAAKPAESAAPKADNPAETEQIVLVPTKPDVPTESADSSNVPEATVPSAPPKPRPVFRPGMKPAAKAEVPARPTELGNSTEGNQLHPLTDPAPDEAEAIAMVGVAEKPHVTEPLTTEEKNVPDAELPQPVSPKKTAPFRPTMKPAATSAPVSPALPVDESVTAPEPTAPKPKPAFKPTMKPTAQKPVTDSEPTVEPTTDKSAPTAVTAPAEAAPAKPKPAFRPTMKPASPKPASPEDASGTLSTSGTSETPASEPSDSVEAAPPAKPKPAFRPTMKPKSSD